MATVGDQLTAPEPGWKRYDDTNPALLYIGNWSTFNDSSDYNGNHREVSETGAQVKFSFIGSKFRLIAPCNPNNRSNNISITIDGSTENFSERITSGMSQVIAYEKLNLPNQQHTVTITLNDNNYLAIDAIDIDDTGRLLHPDEVTNVADLDIGKRIRCHYRASSGQVGVFSGLGEETSDFIPPTGSASPNGDFYWICVDRDHLGRWKLIADRNIQHSISWDRINEQGMTNTGREITF